MDARQLAIEGGERALAHANRELFTWGDEALGWVRKAAAEHEFITSGYVRLLARYGGLPEAPEPRAWGAVMRRARREGLIVPTDKFVSGPVVSHGRPERVWKRA